jgi:PAS domain S-box-containing protein
MTANGRRRLYCRITTQRCASWSLENRTQVSGNRAALLKYLSTARRYVATGERDIDRQRELIAWQERHGHDSREAKRLLALFGELQKLHMAGRDLVEQELAGLPIAEANAPVGLREATDLLSESRDRLQLALDAAQLGAWQFDPRRGIAWWDTRTQEIWNIPKNEARVEELVERVHPDDREMFMAARKAALDPADPKPFAIQYRILWSDGKIRWVESRGLAYFHGVGRKRRLKSFVGTIQDITERKEREEKEHLLMREINHRAKNMLSVVASIAHQTAARNPDEFVARFAERIQALSANQDLLVRSEWSGVEIENLARAQLAPFADLIGSRITMQGPALRLTPASAQAIGLALHELATNAGKYGALSTDKGRVEISWGVADGTFTMSWTERNGPPVSAPQRRGFGSVVMEAMAERSVSGKVHLDYEPSGLTWRLTCLSENVLDPRNGAP